MTTGKPILGPWRSENDALGKAFLVVQQGCRVQDLERLAESQKRSLAWLLGDTGLSATLRRRPTRVGKERKDGHWITMVSINGAEPQADVNLQILRTRLELLPTDQIQFLGVKLVKSLAAATNHDADVINEWRRRDTSQDSIPAVGLGTALLNSNATKGAAKGRKIDWAEVDFRNRTLGEKGEQFVLADEKRHLSLAGRKDLAKEVRWVSKLDGDGYGYDIRSFDEKDGSERFIEVKTTNQSDAAPFYVSKSELECSRRKDKQFYLYRVYNFSSAPRIRRLNGTLDDKLILDACVYCATIKK